jgi:hypothetical protein
MGEKVYHSSRDGLYSYLLAVIPYLIDNKTRLQISSGNITKLTGLYGDPATQDTYMYYYTLYADGANTRTRTVLVSLTTVEKNIKKLLSSIYNDIPDSVWTDKDRTTFNRKSGLPRIITEKKTPIKEKCFAHVTLIGNGDIKVVFSTTNDKTVASKPEYSNAVEVAGRIDEPFDKSELADNELASKVKYPLLKSPDDDTQKSIYTKTTNTISHGAENSGNYWQFFSRWINVQNPGIAGTWTGPWTTMIP